MKKSISTLIIISSVACAHIIPIDGQTWPFAEKNAIQELKEIAERDKDIVNARMNKAKTEAIEKMKHYKAPNTVKLTRAEKDRIFYPDMHYELDRDIVDGNGKLLYPKGFKFDIMQYTTLPFKIIIFDPTDEQQVKWYEKSGYNSSMVDTVLITDGEAYGLVEKMNRPIYYLSKPIADRFKLEHSPCIIEQVGGKIQISEISTTAKKKK